MIHKSYIWLGVQIFWLVSIRYEFFTERPYKANFDSDIFFMDFKQNQYINRGDYIKIDKNSTNLQGVKKLLHSEKCFPLFR